MIADVGRCDRLRLSGSAHTPAKKQAMRSVSKRLLIPRCTKRQFYI